MEMYSISELNALHKRFVNAVMKSLYRLRMFSKFFKDSTTRGQVLS